MILFYFWFSPRLREVDPIWFDLIKFNYCSTHFVVFLCSVVNDNNNKNRLENNNTKGTPTNQQQRIKRDIRGGGGVDITTTNLLSIFD